MDPRLRAAVDASRAWYDDVLALHAVPVRVEDGLWQALGDPPPWHSSVKTLEPGVAPERVLEAAENRARCGVADSFGELDLGGDGFGLVVDATWLHRPADRSGAGPTAMPAG
jgi:hypothetical protein